MANVMPHSAANFVFERPEWMPETVTTDNGRPIAASTGVLEKADDVEYWKVLQRIEKDDEYRVRASVWSYDPDTDNRHRDQTSDLNVPIHIWNQLILNARRIGIFETE